MNHTIIRSFFTLWIFLKQQPGNTVVDIVTARGVGGISATSYIPPSGGDDGGGGGQKRGEDKKEEEEEEEKKASKSKVSFFHITFPIS